MGRMGLILNLVYVIERVEKVDLFYMQYIERKTEKDLYFGDYKSAIQPCNHAKNRYSNVLPRMVIILNA